MDEASAVLAFSQTVKEDAGVKDSFTEEKTDKDIKEDSEAKNIYQKFVEAHPEENLDETEAVEPVSVDDDKPDEKDKKNE